METVLPREIGAPLGHRAAVAKVAVRAVEVKAAVRAEVATAVATAAVAMVVARLVVTVARVATLVMTVAPVARAQIPSFSPTTRFTVFVFVLENPRRTAPAQGERTDRDAPSSRNRLPFSLLCYLSPRCW